MCVQDISWPWGHAKVRASAKSCRCLKSWGGICKGAINKASQQGGAGSRPLTYRQDPTMLPAGSCHLSVVSVQNQLVLGKGENIRDLSMSPDIHGFAFMTKRQGMYCPWPRQLNPGKILGFCSFILNKIKHPPDGSREREMRERWPARLSVQC